GPAVPSDARTALRSVKVPDLTAALAGCLRETDLVGWHRTDRRAGALLTEVHPGPDVAGLVGNKGLLSLGAVLPAEAARGLRVRVYRYGAPGLHSFDRLFSARTADVTGTTLPNGTEVSRMAHLTVGPPPSRAAESIVARQARV